MSFAQLPAKGTPRHEVLRQMERMRERDASWKKGKTWSLVYHASDEHTEFLKKAYTMSFSENGLNPIAFPSLRQFEAEVLQMAAGMLGGGPTTAGTMTSGGTESILMAVKTYREWARATRPHIKEPEMIVPLSVHPAFQKAAYYFNVKPVVVPTRPDFRADVEAMRAAITPNTILMVGSAPSYPQGVIDPIAELAAIAQQNGLGMHVDACLGGFLLPWVEKLGYPIPPFDFRVPGVTSMSADIHKYGFAAKGASIVLYKDEDLRRHQFFVYTEWPGGIYGSPSATGTRPGGAIAAAWAAMMALGEDGYMEIARIIMDTSRKLQEGINAIPGVHILGKPDMSVFTFGSDEVDAYAVADALDARGWAIDRQQNPVCLHMMITPVHAQIVDDFVADVRQAVEQVRANPSAASEGSAAMYGMMAQIPDRGMVKNFVLEFLDGLYRT